MQRVRAANPGPAALWVVNPPNKRRTKKMATRRRRRTTRRRARRNPVLLNPTRRRRTRRLSTLNPRRRRTVRRRRRNPMMMNTTRRRRYRRRNPVFGFRRRRRVRNQGGLFARGVTLATFAALQQFLLMWVPPIGGVSAVADAGRTAALGWLLSVVMRRTGFLTRYADEAALAGFTLAGGKLITAFVLPFATRVFQPAPPAETTNNNAQMSGMATYFRGQQPFRRYAPVGSAAGMRGMASYARGQQPYGAYGTYTGALIA